ncbi:hypothetical protein L1987_71132 [Smallanthus sonchifolius]|uniref:Uncharacterized protein n=1 Tax=Smallanthus sonchifolius TaxID=185202 RepID=A0ACB9ARW7_9ASTR|nr:hypothetical protein L1987_71132 [Smallanthus sonchifolius]
MEPLKQTPTKTTNTYLKLHKLLHEIEALVTQFTDLPIDTPGLDLLTQVIVKKFVFFRNFLIHETVSYNSMPDDLSEIKQRLREHESEFHRSNLHPVSVHEDDDSDDGSVCESCLNYDREFQGDAASDASGVDEFPEMLYGYEVMVPDSPEDLTMPASDADEVEEAPLLKEKSGKRRRKWWWRTVVILMPASVVLAVSYFEKKQREGFLTPT